MKEIEGVEVKDCVELKLPIDIFLKDRKGKAVRTEEINVGYGFTKDGTLRLMEDEEGKVIDDNICEAQIKVQRSFMYGLELEEEEEDKLANKAFVGLEKPKRMSKRKRLAKCYRCGEKDHTMANCTIVCKDCGTTCASKNACFELRRGRKLEKKRGVLEEQAKKQKFNFDSSKLDLLTKSNASKSFEFGASTSATQSVPKKPRRGSVRKGQAEKEVDMAETD